MTDTPYSNRELDAKFDAVHEKLDAIIQDKLDPIIVQTTATNGKVRKIILALVGLFFFVLGLGFTQLAPLVTLLL